MSGLADLPSLPQDEEGPVFREPWEAQAFAMAVLLSERGHFTWKEWADRLAREIREAAQRGEPDDGSRYYHYWLTVLERIMAEKAIVLPDELALRKADWDRAARATPHGTPIVLGRRARE